MSLIQIAAIIPTLCLAVICFLLIVQKRELDRKCKHSSVTITHRAIICKDCREELYVKAPKAAVDYDPVDEARRILK